MNNPSDRPSKKSHLVADGAMGTLIMERTSTGKSPTLHLLHDPDLIVCLHEEYVLAGAELIQTFTFGTNQIALQRLNLVNELENLNRIAVACARKAIGNRPVKLSGNIGSAGLSPMSFAEQKDAVRSSMEQQIMIFCDLGVDLISFETITTQCELELVLDILERNRGIQSVVSLTPDRDLNLFDGMEFSTWFEHLDASPVTAFGLNCVHDANAIVRFMQSAHRTSKLISIRASAGLPISLDQRWIYPVDENAYCIQLEGSGAFQANLIGGCCGTTPAYTRKIKTQLS